MSRYVGLSLCTHYTIYISQATRQIAASRRARVIERIHRRTTFSVLSEGTRSATLMHRFPWRSLPFFRTDVFIGPDSAGLRTTAPGLACGRRTRTPSTTWTRARRSRRYLRDAVSQRTTGTPVAAPQEATHRRWTQRRLRQRAARRDGVERAVTPRLGDEER
jgi:hypothetical protein